MRSTLRLVLAGALACGWMSAGLQPAPAQSFTGEGAFSGSDTADLADSPDGAAYTEGMQAINNGRWPEAEAIFAKIANLRGSHSDGALYWEAYAQNRQEHRAPALATCAELGRAFPTSSWVHECGALEIEIRAESGKPMDPHAMRDDDLKLLALNALVQKNESQALAQIQEILNGSASPRLKKEALFILGQHGSDETYPQIVRIRYMEGDVRIARGEQKDKPANATWETAVANLPLQTGFSLATGAGRAEIEFEDASTLYLGENSVLVLNDLHTTQGVPHTDVALLAGTVSLDVHPYLAGEGFLLKTPTDDFYTTYPRTSRARISSYLDGIAVTTVPGAKIELPGVSPEDVAKGQTFYFREGRRIEAASLKDSSFTEWDKWVAGRVAQRTADMNDEMKAAGLSSPLPGLEDMKGQGTFFECAPYGTCWEPKGQSENSVGDNVSQAHAVADAERQPRAHLVQAGFIEPSPTMNIAPLLQYPFDSSGQGWAEYFPCFPNILYGPGRDPSTGRFLIGSSGIAADVSPWQYAVCHAGGWISRHHHYTWVTGTKRHHEAPIRWVKSGPTVGFVPIHPYDLKGRPAINRNDEVFAIDPKNGHLSTPVKFSAGSPIEVLKAPPKQFRTSIAQPLARAEAPHMEAHLLRENLRENPSGSVKSAALPMNFDPRTKSFLVAREITRGGKSITVATPISNRGDTLQAHGASFAAGGHGTSGAGAGGSHAGSTGSSAASHSSGLGSSSGASAAASSATSSHH